MSLFAMSDVGALQRRSPMRKELGDDQVRVTTRLPRALYAELEAIGREHWTVRGTSELIRHALLHYLDCPDRHLAAVEREAYKQWLIDHHLP
jgi:hypothetical protein